MSGAFRPLVAAVALSAAASPLAAMDAPTLKPPPPGPAFLAQPDLDRLKKVKELVSKRQYSAARALAAEMTVETARSLGEWYYFDAEDPLVAIADADRFLDAHPEWPSALKIQTHVEKRLLWTTSPALILEFFKSRDPVTGEGKVQLARAQLATGAPEAATLHIKDAWIKNNFILADEQRLLANYGGYLTPDDHAARVDRLLWSREVSTAKRVFSRLRAEDRRRAEARAALLLGGPDGLRLYSRLSAEDRADPGVMLAAVRHFRRAEEEPRAIAIARAAPTDPIILRQPERWWDEQQLLMRWALKNRQYADAYAMASHHGLQPGGADFAEAEFNAGWIALRFLNDPARAETHFAALTAKVSAPISVSRGWYWLARAAEAKGEAAIAARRYGKAAEQIYTFYGQLAAEKVGGGALTAAFEEGPPATPEEKARFGSRPAVAALRMLTDLKDDRAFLVFAYHIDDQLQSRGEFKELADLAMRVNAPHVAVRAGKVAVRTGEYAADIAYPDISVPNSAARFAPAEVILGLSRQESEFNPRAYSRAGARGMMQLIPSTAQATARKERIAYRQSALLDDPHYNMTLGAAHLSHLINRYGGSWIMTFAAYNAGVNRVEQWVEAYGDPRAPGADPLDWMEQIPFEETRNYVQRVLENSQIYRSRLNNVSIAGKLAADIERGGPQLRVASVAPISAPGLIPDIAPRIVALAEPILNPLASVPDALAHVRLKPRPSSATAAQAEPPTAKTQTRGLPRPSFRPRKIAPPPEGPHDESPPTEAPVAAQSASPIAENSATPAPLIMEPVDSAAEIARTESEAAYASEALIAPEAAGRPFPAPQGDGDAALEPAEDACVTYSDFIAETAKEEASADDLNAGALAEFMSGGSACQ
ncbi:MAG: transglycosylase SLT domain-containing protein [Parvularculaceae bacterium]|nr:transglycosylase SLT domain-containing protein [Parvularculaceae bacterium]